MKSQYLSSSFSRVACAFVVTGAAALSIGGCPPTTPPGGGGGTGVTQAQVDQLIADNFNAVNRDLALWNIQPGLGTVMIEYGKRFALLKFAADSGDWGMAQYQLKEAIEIQEVGETTRPANAALLKNFEDTNLAPLSAAIQAKDATAFNTAFTQAIAGCNACHVATGHDYVVIQPPTVQPEDFLLLAASDTQTSSPSTPTTPPTPGTTPLSWAELTQTVDDVFNTVDRNLALWNIQPGLGTVMMEYGKRLALIKFAADAGDWGMAQYQLKEAIEIQEVGETTRPARAPLLKNFEQTYLDPLSTAINAQDSTAFGTAYTQAISGCNACHVATGFSFVRFQSPPTQPQTFLVLGPSDVTPPSTTPPSTPATPTFPSGNPTEADATTLIQDKLNTLDRDLALWNIQPGLGTVMQEYGHRFALTSLAADAGNWGMAAYQLKEAIEIQEVGETTRPARADLLKNFEHTNLDPLSAAITAQDTAAFHTAYTQAIAGCNACHVSTGFSFVVVQNPPDSPADFLKLAN
ncbi:MAG: hypothetical protein HY287_17940 [Planctomycetes bacterium]|nr:hypothetical protein [Planctomycetota bacterium]MBI3836206.1 hypothetical protein [Planctomycetota bacterium]